MDALSTLYSELGGQLIRYANTFTGEIHSAEDVVSETFLRATEHCIVNNNIPTRAWFYKVTRNIALDWLRKRGKMNFDELPEIIDHSRECNPEKKMMYYDNIDRLMNSIGKLPEMYKSVLVLREYNELSYLEIANVLDISIDNVKVLIFRAKQKLRELYRRDE